LHFFFALDNSSRPLKSTPSGSRARLRVDQLSSRSSLMETLMPRHAVLSLLCATVVLSALPIHAATVRTVALTGQQAPGMPTGISFGGFETNRNVVLNDQGQVTFGAFLSGTSAGASKWSEGLGTLSLVALEASAAPGTPAGVNFAGVAGSNHILNNSGQSAFASPLAGSGVHSSNDHGIWLGTPTNLALVARKGDQAAGAPAGVNYADFVLLNATKILELNDAGQVAFGASLTGSGVTSVNDSGIWFGTPTNLTLAAREGDQAPGTPTGIQFAAVNLTPPALNNAGHVAFSGSLTGSGVNTSNDTAIWSSGTGLLTLVAREGDPAAGTPPGVNFGGLARRPALNSVGQTAFIGDLVGAGVDAGNDTGMWRGNSGNLTLLAREGSQVPGQPSGVIFTQIAFRSPMLNNTGQVAFLEGGGQADQNVWLETPGGFSLVASVGDQAPGMPPGINFTDIHQNSLRLNDLGQVVFLASTGGGASPIPNGIWATDIDGVLQLVVRIGDSLEVAPGDFRTISQLFIVDESPNFFGTRSAFNNLGQIAFTASFTDGSQGVFVTNLVAVPEPDLLYSLSLGLLAILVAQRPCHRYFINNRKRI
jgi:hypothetical protein